MPPPSEGDRDLARLESDLRRLEAEYNMYFSGRAPRPPWESRARVAASLKRYDKTYVRNTSHRFRFNTIQSRFATFVDLWDRALRAKEEGRPGPLSPRKGVAEVDRTREGRVLYVATLRDPALEAEKLRALHESLSEARREVDLPAVAFDKFADLVKSQMQKLQADGTEEVAFRVAVSDGKVHFTARAHKGAPE